MELDLKALKCFAVLAEELNFSRAAVRLNLSQPALSTESGSSIAASRLGCRVQRCGGTRR